MWENKTCRSECIGLSSPNYWWSPWENTYPSGLQFSPETVHQPQKLLSSVQSLSYVWLFATPWTAACQASLSITNSWSLLNLCPLSQWCHLTISSSVVPFSSHLKSFPALGSFPSGKGSFHQFFASGGQRIGASASAKATICVYFYLFPGLNTWESYTRLDVVNLSVADLRLKSRQDPDS